MVDVQPPKEGDLRMSISAISSANSQIKTTQVSAAVLRKAEGDGDGRRGAAALNDNDAAAHSAARYVSQSKVDIKA
jgi:hypothetical protein